MFALTRSNFVNNCGSILVKMSICSSSNFSICWTRLPKSLSSRSKYLSFSSTKVYEKKGLSEAYSEPNWSSNMEIFAATTNGFQEKYLQNSCSLKIS